MRHADGPPTRLHEDGSTGRRDHALLARLLLEVLRSLLLDDLGSVLLRQLAQLLGVLVLVAKIVGAPLQADVEQEAAGNGRTRS